VREVRRLVQSQWLVGIIVLAGVELLMLGSATSGTREPGARPVDGLGVVLLGLAGLAITASRRWRSQAFGTGVVVTLIYAWRGYPTDGPIFLTVPVTLYSVVEHASLRRAMGLSAVALVAIILAGGQGGLPTFDPLRLLMLPVGLGAVVVIARLMGSRSRQLARLREAEAQRLVTEERLRIARELHDIVSHTIATINVQAGVAAHLLDAEQAERTEQTEQAREALLAIKAASKEALQELRGVLHVLRQVDTTEADPRSPAPGLEQVDALAQATTRAGLPTSVHVDGAVRRLSPAVELTAYRVVQEALTNALRYAAGASAQVSVVYAPERLVVEVVDDGPGLGSSNGASVGAGLGLRGLRERVAAVGGQVEAGPREEGGGFRVRASLPAASAG
jgi:signal transduction histidine kinase